MTQVQSTIYDPEVPSFSTKSNKYYVLSYTTAARHFGHALVENQTLVSLNIAANLFGEKAAYVIGKMLFHNKSLRDLDLSSNNLGKKGKRDIVIWIFAKS